MMACKYSNLFKIVFDCLTLALKWLIRYLCVNWYKIPFILDEQCALMHMLFGNNYGVGLLEHVC